MVYLPTFRIKKSIIQVNSYTNPTDPMGLVPFLFQPLAGLAAFFLATKNTFGLGYSSI